MSTGLPKVGISSIPRPVVTGYGPDRADTVATGTIAGVVAAGGVPVILPVSPPSMAAAQLEGIDGLVLSGGHDLAIPAAGEPDEDRWIDPARDEHELALWEAASAARLPVLGICRGAQLVNHARGGRLVHHIEGHDAAESHLQHPHAVEIAGGTRLAAALGTGSVGVNTIHHQAVAEPGHGLVVSARAGDVIEGIETIAEEPWFVGVQWHPELMPGLPAGDGLFEALLTAVG